LSNFAREMSAEEYRRQVESRRRRGLRRLGEAARGRSGRSPVAHVLAKAARVLRLREQAEQAWSKVVPPLLAGCAFVDGLVGDALVVAAVEPAAGYELRRCQGRLERQLRRLVPGLRHLRIVVAGQGMAGSEGESPAQDRS